MTKKVYLFELDSAKATNEEVLSAQKALYDEIVNNENHVVISYNQLTDSRVMVSMLQNTEYFNVLLELFKGGHIYTSRYGDCRTASQYVQNAIQKNLACNKNTFIFSSLPVKSNQKYLLKLMQRALKYADLSEFTEYLEDKESSEQNLLKLFEEVNPESGKPSSITLPEATRRLTLLKKFIQLILTISFNELTANPAVRYNEEYKSFTLHEFIEKVLMMKPNAIQKQAIKTDWNKIIECITSVQKELRTLADSNKLSNIDNRSDWLKKILEISKKSSSDNKIYYQAAEAVVNICYNYTIEHSMFGVSKHYCEADLWMENPMSFTNDFFLRMEREWAEGLNSDIKYLKEETDDFVEYSGEYLNWERALRIIRKRKNNKKASVPAENSEIVPLYEENYIAERKKQKRKNIRNLLSIIAVMLLCILGIAALDLATSYVEDRVSLFLKSAFTFIGFIVIGSLTEKILPESDIIECTKNIFTSLSDLLSVLTDKYVPYFNKSNLLTKSCEKLPLTQPLSLEQSSELKEYAELMIKRNELFNSSDIIKIVNPKTETDTILDYEIRSGKKIGIVYKSDYHMMLVDLIYNSNGYYTYERLIPAVANGAVVIVPKYNGKFVLLRQFRHALRKEQLSFPRGFGEVAPDGGEISSADNVLKELREELDVTSIDGSPEPLGEIVADSGILGNTVSVYSVNITQYNENASAEGITSVCLMNEEELTAEIRKGNITDGFTLSAFTLLKYKQIAETSTTSENDKTVLNRA